MQDVPVRSAGLLVWRRPVASGVEVLIAHMGGPLWSRKDDAAWSIPKGLYDADEPPLQAALREFAEELGLVPPVDPQALVPLGEFRQRSGKLLTVWAGEGDLDPAAVVPGTFTMEWPPRSGQLAEFPEVDRVAWLSPDDARPKLVAGQRPVLDRLLEVVDVSRRGGA
jgi:predicted NUDIX family NTP pyrophosphohydrolase